jgi:simple sugar transport system ATP-binding protein
VLARELDGDPALIVAENPTRGLDIRASAFVREQIRAARGRGAAVVVYSSDLDEILDLADRVLVVHSGVVSEVALDRGRIGAAMLGAA